MWVNPECTVRPVVGQVYEYLFIQLFKTYGFDQGFYGDGGQCVINTPTVEWPDDPYEVVMYFKWGSASYDDRLYAGMVIECRNYGAYQIEPDYKFSFDPLT